MEKLTLEKWLKSVKDNQTLKVRNKNGKEIEDLTYNQERMLFVGWIGGYLEFFNIEEVFIEVEYFQNLYKHNNEDIFTTQTVTDISQLKDVKLSDEASKSKFIGSYKLVKID